MIPDPGGFEPNLTEILQTAPASMERDAPHGILMGVVVTAAVAFAAEGGGPAPVEDADRGR